MRRSLTTSMPATPLIRSRRFQAAFGVLLALLVAMGVLANHAFSELRAANRWSLHTYEVLTATDELQVAVAELEAGFRGFALTRGQRYLDQWERARAEAAERVARVDSLTGDNPEQQRRVETVARSIEAWTALQRASGVLDPALPREEAIGRASAPAASACRAAEVARARAALRDLEQRESTLLGERADRAGALERRAGALILGGSAFAVLLALATAGMVARRTRTLAELNRALEAEVAEKERVRGALERLGRQSELILESVAEGICGVDAAGYTLFLNPAAGRLLRVRPDDAVGRPVETVLGGSGEGAAAAVRDTLESGAPSAAADLRLRRADGSSFLAELACAPILDPDVEGAVATFRDVSERREVERMKDEFVSVVSHELRTPLTSIRGSLGLLAAGKLGELPEKGRRMLEIAVQNTDRLVRLINDILDIERIDSGRVELEQRTVDAAELARQAAEVMAPLAERSGVSLEVEASPAALKADPDRVLQVLTNLLSNAVKFSPPGAAVTLAARRAGADVCFSVRDRGRGIPADRLESIFERFQQVDSSDAREKGGTGLGLAISRSIVQQQGGSIRATSAPGEGSTFTVLFPAAADAPAAGEEDHAGPLVLVCDDDPTVEPAVLAMLEGWGYRTARAADGAEAVRLALRLRPAAILLDMVMPGMDGVETLRALRERPETRDIPVVVLSALKPCSGPPGAPDGVEWVEKPFAERPLLEALEEAVGSGFRPRRVLVVEDDPDLARVLVESFARHGVEARHAASGVEAVEASRRAPPDLVVLDLGLPHGDGYWVVEALREEEALRGAPLVVYSAREPSEEERARLRLGHTEFLTKGRISPDDFERRVISLLNRIAPAGRRREDG